MQEGNFVDQEFALNTERSIQESDKAGNILTLRRHSYHVIIPLLSFRFIKAHCLMMLWFMLFITPKFDLFRPLAGSGGVASAEGL